MSESKRLNLASAINIFGTSFTWTGLPALLFLQTGSIIFSSLLFVSASVARIIASLFGGYLIDQISSKKITILSLMINTVSLILLYICLLQDAYVISFIAMLVIQFFGSVYSMSKNIWYRSLISKGMLIQGIAKMNSYEMSAKTVGFTIGPLIFTFLAIESLLLNLLFTFLALILIVSIPFTQVENSVKSSPKWKTFKEAVCFIQLHPTLKAFSIATVLNGVIAPTLLSMATAILIERYSIGATYLSYFWLVAGGGVIVANVVLSKFNVLNLRYSLYKCCIIFFLIGGLIAVAIAPSYIIFLIGYVMMTFATPLMMNVIQAEIFKEAKQEIRGKIMSLIQASADLGTLLMILLSWVIIKYGYIDYFLWLLVATGIAQIKFFLLPYKQIHAVKDDVLSQFKE